MQESFHHAARSCWRRSSRARCPRQRRGDRLRGLVSFSACWRLTPADMDHPHASVGPWRSSVMPAARELIAAVTASLGDRPLVILLVTTAKITAPFSNRFLLSEGRCLSVGFRAVSTNLMFNIDRTLQVSDYRASEFCNRIQYWDLPLAGLAWMSRRVEALRVAFGCRPSISSGRRVPCSRRCSLMLVLTVTNQAEYRIALGVSAVRRAHRAGGTPGRAAGSLSALLDRLERRGRRQLFVGEFEAGHRDHFIWDRRGVSQLERPSRDMWPIRRTGRAGATRC